MTLLSISPLGFDYWAWLPVLIVVILIHELGHFLVARWCGVTVDTFSIGFGPEITSFRDRHGTRWRIAAIPLGGYVKFMDDENGASMPARDRIEQMTPEQRAGAFQLKPLWQRAAVVAAGPAANFLSAILMFAIIAYVMGISADPPVRVEVVPDGPAAAANLQTGDVITGVNGTDIRRFGDLLRVMMTVPVSREVKVDVLRDGKPLSFSFVPQKRTVNDGFGGKDTRPMLGVKLMVDKAKVETTKPSPIGALAHGAQQTWQIIADTYYLLTHPWIFFEKVGGLPTMVNVSNKVASLGIMEFLAVTALISVSIGFVNLLPVPILDGGHLMFYALEAIRGKPLPEPVQELSYRVGFVLIASLMLLGLWNDRLRVCGWFGFDCAG